MREHDNVIESKWVTPGVVSGALGVLAFSLSLPLTKVAVAELDPVVVAAGRALLAAMLAMGALWRFDRRIPSASLLWRAGIVALGVVVGFPLLSSVAMQKLPAGHGAVLVALSPLATAALGVLRGKERVPVAFWVAGVVGAGAVTTYALLRGGGQLVQEDLLVLLAVALVSVGYAEGGLLARELGGWRTIAWALVVSVPVLVPVLVWRLHAVGAHAGVWAWASFVYLGAVSMFLGFVAYYRGLAHGGVARISQLQLAQAPLTFCWSAVLLGEPITPGMMAVTGVVVASIGVGQRARLGR